MKKFVFKIRGEIRGRFPLNSKANRVQIFGIARDNFRAAPRRGALRKSAPTLSKIPPDLVQNSPPLTLSKISPAPRRKQSAPSFAPRARAPGPGPGPRALGPGPLGKWADYGGKS